ncbi:MAG: ABC transporter ATP-binding protein [Bacteroidetes bacterium]|nr:ABC transporter ATP-binding protein [Bacteroidota bacterium]
MKYAVAAENISKVYRLYSGPRAMLREFLFNVRGHQLFTALQLLSFQISAGEAFGIIGNNGAGKSTLLKLLAGTCIPTTGSFTIAGRVGALLELGVGFHPEHTGRDNIYFNGAILGLTRKEIDDRIESIITFSELENFIDEPVKTYSSGMYLRLGFSVATGFDFSILIIDEALAVGDQKFQKKCTDRIIDFKENGGTILFCSHNLHQVKLLCDRALWLHEGKNMFLGPARDAVESYQSFLRKNSEQTAPAADHKAGQGKQICWIEKLSVTDLKGNQVTSIRSGDNLMVEVEAFYGPEFAGEPSLGVILKRSDELVICSTASHEDNAALEKLDENHFRGRLVFENIPLMDGVYSFTAVAIDTYMLQAYDIFDAECTFTVRGASPNPGIVILPHRWIE